MLVLSKVLITKIQRKTEELRKRLGKGCQLARLGFGFLVAVALLALASRYP